MDNLITWGAFIEETELKFVVDQDYTLILGNW
jgi:hypothetical protein